MLYFIGLLVKIGIVSFHKLKPIKPYDFKILEQFKIKNSKLKMRILAIDYGTKRCGIAVTDELKLIASPLATVEMT